LRRENGKQLKYYELAHHFENSSLRCKLTKEYNQLTPSNLNELDMLKYGQK